MPSLILFGHILANIWGYTIKEADIEPILGWP